MIFLWNPTQEDFDYTYGGLSYTIKSKTRKKVYEAEGNHILNALGSRGLTRLVFDDDGKSVNEDQIETDAVERNKQFRIRQVYVYNAQNERRKASGQAYNPPTPEVTKYAAELGIELLVPYTMAEGERGQIAKLTEENEALKKKNEERDKTLETLMNKLNNVEKELAGGFVKVKEKAVPGDTMIKCDVCEEEVLAKRMNAHIRNKHGG